MNNLKPHFDLLPDIDFNIYVYSTYLAVRSERLMIARLNSDLDILTVEKYLEQSTEAPSSEIWELKGKVCYNVYIDDMVNFLGAE